MTQRLSACTLDFQEALFAAHSYTGKIRLRHLRAADLHLDKLRFYLRLIAHWHWLSQGQYEHVSRMVAEIGRLLGGWIQQTQDLL